VVTTPASTALLIDLENMVGANAKPGMLALKLDALTSQAGDGIPVIAACAGSRITPASAQVLKDRKITLRKTGGEKNAADKALLEEAARLAGQGCRRFIVASHDSTFARIAELGELEIIAWTSPKIAQKYASRATAVHRVPRPRAATSATPGPAPQPARTGTAPASTATPQKFAAKTDQPCPHARPRTALSGAAVGAGILAAGVLLGAGAVIIGASAALRLLRHPRHC
jgi:hypothetical protein